MAASHREDIPIIGRWWEALMRNVTRNKSDDPHYYVPKPETLCTESEIGSFTVGNGEDVFTTISQSIECAKSEVVLITCFWARSATLDRLAEAFKKLSNNVVNENRSKVRVFIGFSSLSLFQKLFQTSSRSGRTYEPSEWPNKLGLPSATELPGLDIQIKSIFVRPFSVMHPKFVLIDRNLVWLPSCNVSWESWFEGCVSMSGPVVRQFIDFWQHFWLRGNKLPSIENGTVGSLEQDATVIESSITQPAYHNTAHLSSNIRDLSAVYSIFLPSPHHMNPRFRLLWQQPAVPPPTPLNLFILELFQSAKSSIYIQTPNLTSPPVLSAIFTALKRGIEVKILTSERLMILEQLVTAGTTTSRCIRTLIKRYKRLQSARLLVVDEEAGLAPQIGSLTIEYYRPKLGAERQHGEPVQSHLKLTVVDKEWVVLGSGNMDRASWYTSQELGVAFRSERFTQEVLATVDEALAGRKKAVFHSDGSG